MDNDCVGRGRLFFLDQSFEDFEPGHLTEVRIAGEHGGACLQRTRRGEEIGGKEHDTFRSKAQANWAACSQIWLVACM